MTEPAILSAICQRVIAGPDQATPWVPLALGFGLAPNNRTFLFPEAKMEYFPDHKHPSHVIIWTKGSFHVFEYHSINWIEPNRG